jgi:hypothetical protein
LIVAATDAPPAADPLLHVPVPHRDESKIAVPSYGMTVQTASVVQRQLRRGVQRAIFVSEFKFELRLRNRRRHFLISLDEGKLTLRKAKSPKAIRIWASVGIDGARILF